ncbi:MAG: PCRF domain-containing protein [Phycisphaerales bacterium]|nr:PCRF domain-containing protein [Phycisphaerales bacterium]
MPEVLTIIPPNVAAKLDQIEGQHAALSTQLEDPAILADHRKVREISIKKSALQPVVDDYRKLRRLEKEQTELQQAIGPKGDPDLAELAKEELPRLASQIEATLKDCLSRLVSTDDRQIGSVMLELRAGTGGDEAALWTRDLLEMYQKYAARRGWNVEMLDFVPETDAGGIRSAVINIKGEGAWSELLFEAGVHSVKRVPATEAQGRIHTSTATVAALPEPEEVDLKIDWTNEVEEFATRAQGPGGQNVNKVETAWQIHHKPTGIIIKMMEAKSQQQNRERARRLLIAKLYEAERQRKLAERSAARRSQIGTGDRSEKIRTYRYKDGIVADERLPGEFNLRNIVAGDMQELFGALIEQETARRLAEL